MWQIFIIIILFFIVVRTLSRDIFISQYFCFRFEAKKTLSKLNASVCKKLWWFSAMIQGVFFFLFFIMQARKMQCRFYFRLYYLHIKHDCSITATRSFRYQHCHYSTVTELFSHFSKHATNFFYQTRLNFLVVFQVDPAKNSAVNMFFPVRLLYWKKSNSVLVLFNYNVFCIFRVNNDR